MIIWTREPTLNEMLSDPLIETLMQADGVDLKTLRPMLCEVARGLSNTRGSGVSQDCACA